MRKFFKGAAFYVAIFIVILLIVRFYSEAPQDIATLDARKAVQMFRKVNMSVLGVVENMSTHVCSQCGHEEAIFGSGGGARMAEEYDVELLGQLPLDVSIREQTDSGSPTVVAAPESSQATAYRDAARRVAVAVGQGHALGAGDDARAADAAAAARALRRQ